MRATRRQPRISMMVAALLSVPMFSAQAGAVTPGVETVCAAVDFPYSTSGLFDTRERFIQPYKIPFADTVTISVEMTDLDGDTPNWGLDHVISLSGSGYSGNPYFRYQVSLADGGGTVTEQIVLESGQLTWLVRGYYGVGEDPGYTNSGPEVSPVS